MRPTHIPKNVKILFPKLNKLESTPLGDNARRSIYISPVHDNSPIAQLNFIIATLTSFTQETI